MNQFLPKVKDLFEDQVWYQKATARDKLKNQKQQILDEKLYDYVLGRSSPKALTCILDGATNDFCYESGRTALHWACFDDFFGVPWASWRYDVIEKLLQLFPEELNRSSGIRNGYMTPIGFAIYNKQWDVCKLLINKNAQHCLFNWIIAVGLNCLNGNSTEEHNAVLNMMEDKNQLPIKSAFKRILELQLLNDKKTWAGISQLNQFYQNNPKMKKLIEQSAKIFLSNKLKNNTLNELQICFSNEEWLWY